MKILLASLSVLVLASFATADVRVVSPAGQYTTIQAAIDAARDDDVILVKSGTYPSFTVRAKSLVIAEDVGHVVRINGAIRIGGIDATRTVTLMGLENVGGTVSNTALQHGLRVVNSSGLVFVQDCTLRASLVPTTDTTVITQPRPALLVENSLSVVLTNCTVLGSDSVLGQSPNYYPTAGLPYCSGVPSEGAYLSNSGVSFFQCSVFGGPGRSAAVDGSHGAHGIWAVGSALFLCRSTVAGGAGANGNCFSLACQVGSVGGDGGNGVLADGGTACITRATTPVGGAHGIFTTGFGGSTDNCYSIGCTPSFAGINGASVHLLGSSTRTTQATIQQTFSGPTILREKKTGQLSFTCDPGATVRRYSSREGIASYDPVTQSIQVTSFGPSFRDTLVGVGAGAPLFDPITGPKFASGETHRLFYYQCVQISGIGARLGTPRVVLVVAGTY